MTNEKEWDVFISHASEDKEALVRPLATELRRFGLSVWYDEFSLEVGDSISRSIDRGLANSRFGLVVISPRFIAKRWPEYELRGLVAREMRGGKVIVPIWYGVTHEQVLSFSRHSPTRSRSSLTALTSPRSSPKSSKPFVPTSVGNTLRECQSATATSLSTLQKLLYWRS